MGPHYQNDLVNHINILNQQTRDRGAVGFLTNDPDHWAGYGVYTIGDFQLYLEREHERNMYKNSLGE
tara:strand:+ start:985 stop:1185 length:201 start_codon:yes stop_codon:yes gene_type:complete